MGKNRKISSITKPISNTIDATKRGGFSSSMGFILAATGSAVGLGNIWKFPYVAGQSGGGVFFIFYLVFTLLIGVPILIAEMTLGRKTRQNPVGAYRKLDKRFTFAGGIGVACAFVVLSFYSVIGGWVFNYLITYGKNLLNTIAIAEPVQFYNEFISSSLAPVTGHLVFMLLTCLIVLGGVSAGIEKTSKILLPALFVLIIAVVVRSVTLPDAWKGLSYLFIPDWSSITSTTKLLEIVLSAMGQVFFTLSIGAGTMITYGSYLTKETNIVKAACMIPLLDTLVAVLAGMAILPAVFSFGLNPGEGPGLLFVTLPTVFNQMPFGSIFGFIFFLLVLVAAVTSSVSLLEVVVSFGIDTLKLKRKTSSVLCALAIALLGVITALSFGAMSSFRPLGLSMFDLINQLADKLLMPLGGIFICVFSGWVLGVDDIILEINRGGVKPFTHKKLLSFSLRYIAPVCILMILVSSLFGLS